MIIRIQDSLLNEESRITSVNKKKLKVHLCEFCPDFIYGLAQLRIQGQLCDLGRADSSVQKGDHIFPTNKSHSYQTLSIPQTAFSGTEIVCFDSLSLSVFNNYLEISFSFFCFFEAGSCYRVQVGPVLIL